MNYDLEDFNDDGLLLPGTFLTLVTFYIGRFLFFGPLSLLASNRGFSGGGSLDLSFLTDVSPLAMFSSIPAAIVIYAMLARSPASSAFIKTLWKWGKLELIVCLMIQMAILVYEFDQSAIDWPVQLAFGTINVFFLLYLFSSSRPKDVFAQFPGDDRPA